MAPTDPYEYGFGVQVMKETKVCKACGNIELAANYRCSKCGERLPRRTLFQIYQQKHKICEFCDTVLAVYMKYCPHCGTKIENHDEAQGGV